MNNQDKYFNIPADVDLEQILDHVDQKKDYPPEEILDHRDSNQAPISTFVNNILRHTIQNDIEQVYIQCQDNNLVIKGRKNGKISQSFSLKELDCPNLFYQTVVNRIKIIAGFNQKDKFPISKIRRIYNNHIYYFIIKIVKGKYSETVSIELINNSHIQKELNQVFVVKKGLLAIKNLINLSSGLIIISGGAKARKTTVSYLILKELVKKNINIYSLEDTIIYDLPDITQYDDSIVQESRNFAQELKIIMGQNPDVIYINKLKDSLTAEEVFSAVSHGKLVIVEMEINSIALIFATLSKWDIKPFEIALNLRGIINLKLAKKTNNNVSSNMEKCQEKMLIVPEILTIDSVAQRAIVDHKNLFDLMEKLRKNSMVTGLEYGLELVDMNLTTLSEVKSICSTDINIS